MKNVYILHGCCDKEEYFSDQYPSPSNFHWIPWLQKQLLMKGYNCQTPEMPKPYGGVYKEWKNLFETYPIDTQTSLIGHSCGCGFFLRWLSETRTRINKLIMVAPWIDPERTRGAFLEFALNPTLPEHVDEMHIFYSSDDEVTGVHPTTKILMEHYPLTKLYSFNDKGHFCLEDMRTEKFPELLALFK